MEPNSYYSYEYSQCDYYDNNEDNCSFDKSFNLLSRCKCLEIKGLNK